MPAQTLSKAHRMSYRIGRGETLVLTFEPYKSEILPLWRFRTPAIARQSSAAIYAKFIEYNDADDFVGMDMSRKFLQMGMTRAKRYANHKGGRKYDKVTGEELEKSKGHEGMDDKLEASEIFKRVWEKAKAFEGYVEKKERFQKEQKEWDEQQKKDAKTRDPEVKQEVKQEVKTEEEEEASVDEKPSKKGEEKKTRVKKEPEE